MLQESFCPLQNGFIFRNLSGKTFLPSLLSDPTKLPEVFSISPGCGLSYTAQELFLWCPPTPLPPDLYFTPNSGIFLESVKRNFSISKILLLCCEVFPISLWEPPLFSIFWSHIPLQGPWTQNNQASWTCGDIKEEVIIQWESLD